MFLRFVHVFWGGGWVVFLYVSLFLFLLALPPVIGRIIIAPNTKIVLF